MSQVAPENLELDRGKLPFSRPCSAGPSNEEASVGRVH